MNLHAVLKKNIKSSEICWAVNSIALDGDKFIFCRYFLDIRWYKLILVIEWLKIFICNICD